MQVRTDDHGGLVALTGRLDVHTVPDVRQVLRAAIDGGSDDIVVDLAGVELLDYTGLGVLVSAHRRAGRAGRTLVLREVPERISRLLLVTHLDKVLTIEAPAAA